MKEKIQYIQKKVHTKNPKKSKIVKNSPKIQKLERKKMQKKNLFS